MRPKLSLIWSRGDPNGSWLIVTRAQSRAGQPHTVEVSKRPKKVVATMKNKPLATRSDDRAWGATVFAGTRVPVDTLLEYLEAGDTLDEFLRQFPTVTRQQAVGVLELARQRVREVAMPA